MAFWEVTYSLLRNRCMSCFLLFGLRIRSCHKTGSVVWRGTAPMFSLLDFNDLFLSYWLVWDQCLSGDLWSQHVQLGHNIAKEDFGMDPAGECELSQILLQESCAACNRECLSTGEGNLIQLWNWPCFEQAGPETSVLWFVRPVMLQPIHECAQKLPANRSATWTRK